MSTKDFCKEECITITYSEFSDLMDWCDNIKYRCGQDGWSPTVQEIENEIIARYHSITVQYIAESNPLIKKNFRQKQKLLIIYLLWISETSEKLDNDTNKVIQDFLRVRLNIVNEYTSEDATNL